jgi:hypothetical protein
MTNSLTTTTGTALVDRSLDAFEQFANSMAQIGTALKFSKGRWFAGYGADEKPADGITLVTDVHGLMVGWRKWQRVGTAMRVVDSALGHVADNFKAPSRNELGDLDESAWERGLDGSPKDPWSFGFFLTLVDPKDDEVYVYAAISNGGRRAVADLVKAFTKQRKQDPAHCVPVVRLMADAYKHRDYGRIDIPKLEVVSWRSSDTTVAALPDPDGSDDADMGDTIPF